MTTVKVTFNGKLESVPAGLYKSEDIYRLLSVELGKECICLKHSDGNEIPLLTEECIIVHGGEEFVTCQKIPEVEINQQKTVNNGIFLNEEKIDLENKSKIKATDICKIDTEVTAPQLYAVIDDIKDVLIDKILSVIIQEGDKFITAPSCKDGKIDVVDIEECSKYERRPPKCQSYYLIKIDGTKYKVDKQEMSGKEILSLTKDKKTFEQWTLSQKLRGGRRIPIEPDQIVDFTKPGIERFETTYRHAQQGL